jgi:hypothetical protein
MRHVFRSALTECYEALLSDRYVTRTAEHLLSWVIIFWSMSVLFYTPLTGGVYEPMLRIAPYWFWGAFGITTGILRVIALIRNGHWRPTPELRLLGAIYGAMFWVGLTYCYYIAVSSGGADFPMRRAMFVFIAFELFAAYRCGHDIGVRARAEALQRAT